MCVTGGPIKCSAEFCVISVVVADRENADLRQPWVNIYERIEESKKKKTLWKIDIRSRFTECTPSIVEFRTKQSGFNVTNTQRHNFEADVKCVYVLNSTCFLSFDSDDKRRHRLLVALFNQDKVEITCVRSVCCRHLYRLSVYFMLWNLNLQLSSRNTLVINIVHASDA